MRRIAALLTLVLAQGGCSLMLVDKPAASYRVAEAPRCSTARGGIGLDVVFAILWGVGGVALLADDEAQASLGAMAIAGVHALSARAGSKWTGRCETWRNEHDAWLAQRSLAPERAAVAGSGGTEIELGARGGVCLPGGTCEGALVCNQEVGRCMRAADLPGPKRAPGASEPRAVAADGSVRPDPARETAATGPEDAPAGEARPDRSGAHARWSEFWKEVR